MVILTDLSEVLVRGLWGTQELIARDFGEDVASKFTECHIKDEETFHDLLRGKIAEADYWDQFITKYSLPFTVNQIYELFSENLAKKIEGTLDVYKSIIERPMSFGEAKFSLCGPPRIILVSDHISERIAQLWSLHRDVFDVIDLQIWSCNVGMIKRDPGYFQNVLEIIDLTPDQVIYIDDMMVNINAAWNDAEIRGIQFINADQLQEELEARDFVFKK